MSRIPESLPCLHDNVLAAAADAALSVSSNQKKKQVQGSYILFLQFYIVENYSLSYVAICVAAGHCTWDSWWYRQRL